MIGGVGDANAAGYGTSAGRIPGDINVVAKIAPRIYVGGNHWFVIEMIAAARKAEKAGGGKTPSPVGRFGDRQLAAVYTIASTKEDNNVAVEQVPAAIEDQTGI